MASSEASYRILAGVLRSLASVPPEDRNAALEAAQQGMSSDSFGALVKNLPPIQADGDPHINKIIAPGPPLEAWLLATHDFHFKTLAALADLHRNIPAADASHLNNLNSMKDVLSGVAGQALRTSILSEASGDPPTVKTSGK